MVRVNLTVQVWLVSARVEVERVVKSICTYRCLTVVQLAANALFTSFFMNYQALFITFLLCNRSPHRMLLLSLVLLVRRNQRLHLTRQLLLGHLRRQICQQRGQALEHAEVGGA